MARIPDAVLQRLKQEVSLQRLIGARGVQLKRHGRDLAGLCPFHDDHSPSPPRSIAATSPRSTGSVRASDMSPGASEILQPINQGLGLPEHFYCLPVGFLNHLRVAT